MLRHVIGSYALGVTMHLTPVLFFLMKRRPPASPPLSLSAASDLYKRQGPAVSLPPPPSTGVPPSSCTDWRVWGSGVMAVPNTHFRVHETPEPLGGRFLSEKKKN